MEEYLRYAEKKKEEKKLEEEIVDGKPIYVSEVIDTKLIGLRDGKLIRSNSHDDFDIQPKDGYVPGDNFSDGEEFDAENQTLFNRFCDALKEKIKM